MDSRLESKVAHGPGPAPSGAAARLMGLVSHSSSAMFWNSSWERMLGSPEPAWSDSAVGPVGLKLARLDVIREDDPQNAVD